MPSPNFSACRRNHSPPARNPDPSTLPDPMVIPETNMVRTFVYTHREYSRIPAIWETRTKTYAYQTEPFGFLLKTNSSLFIEKFYFIFQIWSKIFVVFFSSKLLVSIFRSRNLEIFRFFYIFFWASPKENENLKILMKISIQYYKLVQKFFYFNELYIKKCFFFLQVFIIN